MKHLTFFFFRGLVTILVMDVGARPGDDDSKNIKMRIDAWLKACLEDGDSGPIAAEIKPTGFDPVDPDRAARWSNREDIMDALEPLDKSITHIELFSRILTKFIKKELDIRDADGLTWWLSKLSAKNRFGAHFKIFGNIVEIYGMFQEKPNARTEEDLQYLVENVLDFFTFPYTEKDKHVSSEKLAPLLTELIRCNSDQAEYIAERIAMILWSDKEIKDEAKHSFPSPTRGNFSPYSLIFQAIDAV